MPFGLLYLESLGFSLVLLETHYLVEKALSQGRSARRFGKIWVAVPICLFWTIWRGKNRAVFIYVEPSTQRVKSSFTSALWSWAKIYTDFESFGVTDFLFSLGSV